MGSAFGTLKVRYIYTGLFISSCARFDYFAFCACLLIYSRFEVFPFFLFGFQNDISCVKTSLKLLDFAFNLSFSFKFVLLSHSQRL